MAVKQQQVDLVAGGSITLGCIRLAASCGDQQQMRCAGALILIS